ncbi:MAG TPA: hypothetical protein VLV54_11605 [Thermoanaerobaculia bacterium]|nr:hypothetical protein [Thermoanaerobaculia bacterium]
MNRVAFALVLLLTALPALAEENPSCHKGQSVREDDKTTGVVVLKTRVFPEPNTFDPLFIWTSDEPGLVVFTVLGNSDRARYAHCNGLTLTVDGRAVVMSKPKYQQEASNARAVEYLTADIAWPEAERISTAKTIRYKICSDEFHASPELVCQARDVIESAAEMRKAPAAKRPAH